MEHNGKGSAPNAFIEQFGSRRKGGGPVVHSDNHAKQLAGVGSNCGYGTGMTNTSEGVDMSYRGMKEAHRTPRGPGSSS